MKLKYLITFLFVYYSKISATLPTIALVTGGAGYIGSATVQYLLKKGYHVIVIDKKLPKSHFYNKSTKIINLSRIPYFKFRKNSDISRNAVFIKADYGDKKTLTQLFSAFNITTVLHFGGFIEVRKSVQDPALFYENNVQKTITLLKTMKKHAVRRIIFSSSAAVYGLPKTKIIDENHDKNPINPYGKSKYIIDMILEDFAQAYGFKAISLRYFNAAGALPAYDIGEDHEPETHVIPLLLEAAFESKPFYIFGDNCKTFDKSCIRDFLHIHDIAKAHYLALRYLDNSNCISHEAFNLGTGRGSSIKELIKCVENITGQKITTIPTPKRPGDPDWLIANPTKAISVLGWVPTKSTLVNIIRTAHQYIMQKKLSTGKSVVKPYQCRKAS